MNKLSIVILNWNGEKMLQQFLPSVIKHSRIEGVEICVADNASTDNSCELIRKEFPSVRLICLDSNYGFADGYNRALRCITSTYSLLLNSDVEVTEGWLPPLLEYMDTHPNTVAAQSKVLSWQKQDMFEYAGACGGYIDRYGYPFCRGRIMGYTEKDKGQYDSVVPVFWATGAALLIRTATFHDVGGLDSRFFAHMEEIDLCWRLRSRGLEIVCIPQSRVFHLGGGTLNKENPQKTYLNFRNNLLMLYKNLPEAELKPIMRIRTMLDQIAALQYILKGKWKNAQAVWKARKDFNTLRADYVPIRQENLRKTTSASIPERTPWSLLLQFYLFRKRTFQELFADTK